MSTGEKPTRVLLCADSLEGILTGVAAAYRSRYGHAFQRLALANAGETMSLFSVYVETPPNPAEAARALAAVHEKIGGEAALWIESAADSVFSDRADAIYRFLIRGFANGRGALAMLNDPHVARMHEIHRHFSNEATHWQEFVRFRVLRQDDGAPRTADETAISERRIDDASLDGWEGTTPAPASAEASIAPLPNFPVRASGDLLAAVIAPKHRVIPRIMPFFADRFHGEHFLIYDETNDMAGLHVREGAWFVLRDFKEAHPALHAALFTEDEAERRAQELWRIFFAATDIPERYNPKVQRGLMPLWKRKHLTEFAR